MNKELQKTADHKPSTMLVAINAQEMAVASKEMHGQLTQTIEKLDQEIKTLTEEIAISKKNKWRASGLERQLGLTKGRRTYYYKVRAAVKLGYQIVPNFPGVDVIAVRSYEEKTKLPSDYTDTNHWWRNNEIKTPLISSGEGDYFAPTVKVSTSCAGKTEKNVQLYRHEFGELQHPEFPVKLAHPKIMEVTSEAMALKVFDRICTLPALQRAPKGDPLVIGQILAPKQGYNQRMVSFLIAWACDPRDL